MNVFHSYAIPLNINMPGLDPGIFSRWHKEDGRDRPGHDEEWLRPNFIMRGLVPGIFLLAHQGRSWLGLHPAMTRWGRAHAEIYWVELSEFIMPGLVPGIFFLWPQERS